jgi:hypothetical protein
MKAWVWFIWPMWVGGELSTASSSSLARMAAAEGENGGSREAGTGDPIYRPGSLRGEANAPWGRSIRARRTRRRGGDRRWHGRAACRAPRVPGHAARPRGAKNARFCQYRGAWGYLAGRTPGRTWSMGAGGVRCHQLRREEKGREKQSQGQNRK